MPTGRPITVPAAVTDLRQRIDRWRATRTKRSRIPQDLWVEAARLARDHGVYRISKSLRLNYVALKTLSESTRGKRPAVEARPRPPFIQLNPLPSPAQAGLIVELESPDGGKMTIRVPSTGTMDVLALVNGFFSRGRQ